MEFGSSSTEKSDNEGLGNNKNKSNLLDANGQILSMEERAEQKFA